MDYHRISKRHNGPEECFDQVGFFLETLTSKLSVVFSIVITMVRAHNVPKELEAAVPRHTATVTVGSRSPNPEIPVGAMEHTFVPRSRRQGATQPGSGRPPTPTLFFSLLVSTSRGGGTLARQQTAAMTGIHCCHPVNGHPRLDSPLHGQLAGGRAARCCKAPRGPGWGFRRTTPRRSGCWLRWEEEIYTSHAQANLHEVPRKTPSRLIAHQTRREGRRDPPFPPKWSGRRYIGHSTCSSRLADDHHSSCRFG